MKEITTFTWLERAPFDAQRISLFISLSSFRIQWALSHLCHTAVPRLCTAILVAVHDHLYIRVLLVTLAVFVEHAKLIKAFHIISHLCFVSSFDWPILKYVRLNLRTHTSFQMKWNRNEKKSKWKREWQKKEKKLTSKYSHSISYNNNYDRYKYFIKQ